LTDVTHTFFEKLVSQLERGFDSMVDDYNVSYVVGRVWSIIAGL